MNHIDARAALDNRSLMEWIENRKAVLDSNMSGASNEDHLTRLVSIREKAILDSLLDELEEACKVKEVNSK